MITFLKQHKFPPASYIMMMKHGTFKYCIHYTDGTTAAGWTPYAGTHIANSYLVSFVQQYFQDKKVANQIFVEDVFEIHDPYVWLAHVRDTPEFRFLIAQGFYRNDIASGS